MVSLKNALLLLALLWLTSTAGLAQQAPILPSARARLLTQADTVAALQELFQTKRASNGLFLAATPVAASLTLAGTAASALSAISSSNPSAVLPAVIFFTGAGITAGLLHRYTRYTKSNERDVLNRYERTRKLPGWLKRKLRESAAPRS